MAGPKRPQDRIVLPELGSTFRTLFTKAVADGGYGKKEERSRSSKCPCTSTDSGAPSTPDMFSTDATSAKTHMSGRHAAARRGDDHQSADARCGQRSASRPTNRRIPRSAMAACSSPRSLPARIPPTPASCSGAGLLAKKAVEKGLTVNPGGEDFARARLARGHRLPRQDRPRSRISTRSASRPSATAARLASATPARCIPRSRRPSPRTISSPPACSPATATSRRACIRTSRRTSSCRRRSSSPSRSPGTVDIDLSKDPLGTGQGRRARLSQGHLAEPRAKSARPWPARSSPEVFRRLYTDFAKQNPKWNEIPSVGRRSVRVGREIHLHPGAAVLRRLRHGARAHHRNQGRAPARHLRRFRHHRSHQPRRRDQEDQPRRQIPARERRRAGRLQQLRLAPRQ